MTDDKTKNDEPIQSVDRDSTCESSIPHCQWRMQWGDQRVTKAVWGLYASPEVWPANAASLDGVRLAEIKVEVDSTCEIHVLHRRREQLVYIPPPAGVPDLDEYMLLAEDEVLAEGLISLSPVQRAAMELRRIRLDVQSSDYVDREEVESEALDTLLALLEATGGGIAVEKYNELLSELNKNRG